MTYRDHLHPWCIVRLLPEARSTVVARFRDRTDAEAHLKLLNQLTPAATYQVFFEPITGTLENLEERETGE
ncbi:MAG: hypothetical protein LH679_19045 [Cyanobacteria bacterium CAN_BIN43]|jgi:hypothetical protein|nr:hypothetical protein [Cyanobacteria bacterium CAN_BIN43]